MKCTLFLTAALAAVATSVSAQTALERAEHHIDYTVETQVGAADGAMPLWLTANRHGLSSVDESNGYLLAGVHRSAAADSAHKWRLGYGLDAVAAYGFQNAVTLQQAYADVEYKLVRFTFGAKEHPMQLHNQRLSSGNQTLGINARPVPQVRFELPEYWSITGRSNWAAIKGHLGYGLLTDGNFQEDYSQRTGYYAKDVLMYTRAGYLRLGNAEKFPLTFEGGLEMACQFGGTAYQNGVAIKNSVTFKSLVDSFFGTGGDSVDGVYQNSTGNTLGSWLFSLKYHGKGWSARAYYDHFFEDHSMMFFEYGWRDGQWGLELELPKNPVATGFVYEYMTTKDQSGPVYHDATTAIPDQISAVDNYYNHQLYAGWQHWGQTFGNPLFTSPLYRNDHTLRFSNNRFQAHHFGLSGAPLSGVDYRLLFTYQKSWGTYADPYEDVLQNRSFLAEVHYTLPSGGWKIGASVAYDHGEILGNNLGFTVSLKKAGLLVK